MHHQWNGELKFEFVRGDLCRTRAESFVRDQGIKPFERSFDCLVRFARRCRSRLRGRVKDDSSWWLRIVEQSRPYSKIELK